MDLRELHKKSLHWLHINEGITLCFLFLSLVFEFIRIVAASLVVIMVLHIIFTITITLLDDRKEKRKKILRETEWWKVKEMGGWI
jgi:hypothetical protein